MILLFCLVPFAVLGALLCLPMRFLNSNAQERYVTALFVVLNLAVAAGGLFSFYAERLLSFLLAFFCLGALIFFIVMNSILVWKKVLFHKNYRNLLLLAIPIAAFCVNMMELNVNASERLAFKIEFPRIQCKIESYRRTGIEADDIRLFGDYVAVMWDRGFLDNYSVIVYDESDNLQELHERCQSKTSESDERLQAYEEAFRYEKIVRIDKFADKYYRCAIHE